MTLAVQFAMAGEAAPFLAQGDFRAAATDPHYGFQFFEGHTSTARHVVVAVAGTHPRFQVDAIGTVPASLLTHAVLERYRPHRLINAGTAGGFEARGAKVGDVYLGDEVAVFHDRRIPLPGFEAMGSGHFPVECDRSLAQRLGLKVGIVSTGDSLDCTPEDLRHLLRLEASAKDMEAAGIAWVCERRKVPLVLLKSITDIVDHPASTQSQFVANYGLAVARLAEALGHVVEHFS